MSKTKRPRDNGTEAAQGTSPLDPHRSMAGHTLDEKNSLDKPVQRPNGQHAMHMTGMPSSSTRVESLPHQRYRTTDRPGILDGIPSCSNAHATLGRRTGAHGPDARWCLVTLIGSAYLTSSLNPTRVIGRPAIYAILDECSELIAGIAFSLSERDQMGLLLAIQNATADKVQFCAQHGITITPDSWPVAHLPRELYIAPDGWSEWVTSNIQALLNVLRVNVTFGLGRSVEKTPRIERCIQSLDTALAIERGRHTTRGGPSNRSPAMLNQIQFQRLSILSALRYNTQHTIPKRSLDADMLADGVQPHPLDVWNWAVRNRARHLHVADHDTVRLALFPIPSSSAPTSPPHLPNRIYDIAPCQPDVFIVRDRTDASTIRGLRTIKRPDRSEPTPPVILTGDDTSTGERRRPIRKE